MKEFSFRLLPVIPMLRGRVEKIWHFECPGRLPGNDLRLIVPNGRAMLLLPYSNGMVSRMNEKLFIAAENRIGLVGVCDRPSVIDSWSDTPTACMGIEFSPLSFHRFFRIHLGAVSNSFVYLADIFGRNALDLEHILIVISDPLRKALTIQSFLLDHYMHTEEDRLFTFCIDKIEQTAGTISIAQLEKLTGYSSRWLNNQFNEKLGISAKSLCSITRFQHFYKAMLSDGKTFARQRTWYDMFYDQSHFIRDFKRYTGMPPLQLIETENRFGQLFYS